MGFLDDLKKQASELQSKETVDLAALSRNTALAEAAATTAFRYLNELVKQLAVIRPTSRARYDIDKLARFDGLPLTDFRADVRRKRVREEDVTDHIVFNCLAKSGKKVTLAKDFINEIEKLEPRIRQSGVQCRPEAIRNPDNGKLIEMRYEFVADIVVSVRVVPDHDHGTVRFELRNLDGLETVDCEFSAIEVGQARMDELAKWLVGQPQRFLDGALAVRRSEPR